MKKTFLLYLPVILFIGLLIGTILTQNITRLENASLTLQYPLNAHLSGWTGTPKQESAGERAILANDTEFSKMEYVQDTTDNILSTSPPIQVQTSIVLSGQDMNNSIHRPEGCLPAQGHFDLTSTEKTIILKNGKELKLTQLHTKQNVSPDKHHPNIVNCVHYYVFIGNKQLTNNHIQRMLLDLSDRLLLGKVQRWGYFQTSTPYGHLLNITEEQAEQSTENLISQLLSQLILWDEITNERFSSK